MFKISMFMLLHKAQHRRIEIYDFVIGTYFTKPFDSIGKIEYNFRAGKKTCPVILLQPVSIVTDTGFLIE